MRLEDVHNGVKVKVIGGRSKTWVPSMERYIGEIGTIKDCTEITSDDVVFRIEGCAYWWFGPEDVEPAFEQNQDFVNVLDGDFLKILGMQ